MAQELDYPLDCEVVVIGGGIAGLAAAWQLRHREVLLLESGLRIGGRIRSEPRGDYWLNLGAHIFPSPDSNLGRFVTDVGLETVPIPGSSLGAFLNGRLVVGGRTETYPWRLRMPAAARLSLIRAGVKLRRGVAEYLELARRRPGEEPAATRSRLLGYHDDQTLADFLGPLHPDADALLRAAINRVSAEPEVLSAGAGIAQFAATFNGRSSLYHRNLPGGTAVLVERLAALLGERVVTDARVTSVRNTTTRVRVTATRAGRRIDVTAGAAILATPAFVTRQIIEDIPSGLGNALDAIRYGPYVVMPCLTNERRPMPWDDVYALVVARKAFNMFFNTASVLRGTRERGAGGSLTVYGAASLGAELLDASDDTIAAIFRRDLRSVFPTIEGIEEEVIVQRWRHGIPYSIPGRSAHQERLEEPFGRIVLAGDYLGERGGMDTAATSGLEAANAVQTLLERRQLTEVR